MTVHQLPSISNPEIFEDLICDLFNEIELTNTYKKFGKSGHLQKGIDVFSVEKDTAIQCKKKDLNRKEITIKNELLNDIEKDVKSIIDKKLKINISKLYIASTYKDHPEVDEFCEDLKARLDLNFEIIYWGWQTLESKICSHINLLEKYFPHFIINTISSEQKLQRNLDLKKKIKKDFAKWLDYSTDKSSLSSAVLLRNFEGTQYPDSNEPDQFNEYSWFKAEIDNLYHKGMEFGIGITEIALLPNDQWDITNDDDSNANAENVKVLKIGQINFSDIVDYDLEGDEYFHYPHLFCKFNYEGTPFENIYYRNIDKIYERYELSNKKG
ncbi:hypothetical protein [Flavobacterium anhuiense]|uniref:hypothetical protein n=1 Tax=Flavobacterium anhuiense TaxID=459526 RepID=UPI003D96C39C